MDPFTVPLLATTCGVSVTVNEAVVIWAMSPEVSSILLDVTAN
jgi:hypothetical protein